MKLKLGAAVLAAGMAVSSFALANPDIIKLRDGLMDQNGQAMKILAQMARGNMDFDANVAIAAFNQIGNTAAIYPALFPAGTETGETIAAPQIFSDPDGFAAASAKMVEAAEAAVAAVEANGLDGVGASLGAVGGNCQSCHEGWRTR